jgi:hypothetical protein
MLTYWEILTAIQSNVPVNDSYAQLWGKKSQNNYTIVTYTGTLPAVLAGTKAGYLHRYKIYGNTEQTGTPTPENPIVPIGCGEKTENLFDEEYGTITTSITYLPIYVGSGDFTLSTTAPLVNNTSALLFLLSGNVSSGAGPTNNAHAGKPQTQTSIDGYVTVAYRGVGPYKPNMYQTMLTAGSTAPTSYIPYGYKLPLTSGDTPVDIYIGDDTLSTEEYVDSGTGKIYRMVGGVLTPVDPPVPFPQIPTSAGSTTISWAGEGLAPSQVELEYEKKR